MYCHFEQLKKAVDNLSRNMHSFKNIYTHTFAEVHSSLFSLNLSVKSIHVPPEFNRFLVYIQEISPSQDSWRLQTGTLDLQVQFMALIPQTLALTQSCFTFHSSQAPSVLCHTELFKGEVLLSFTCCLKKDREPRPIQRKKWFMIPYHKVTEMFMLTEAFSKLW